MVIFRPFNTIGPRQTGHYGMVVPRFVQQALAGEPLRCTAMAPSAVASATSATSPWG